MIKAILTSKGQLTIPKRMREHFDLHPGDLLLFEVEGNTMRVRIFKRGSLRELRGSLPATRPYPGKEGVRAEVGRALGRRYRKKPVEHSSGGGEGT